MPRGLDHVIHAVRDLDAAAALYRRLGFTVGPHQRQPWGIETHIIQLPGFFIELLAVAAPADQDGEEGFSVLVLESSDPAADAADFRNAEIGMSDAGPAGSARSHPDGSLSEAEVSSVFAHDRGAPDVGFATCWRRHPQDFWSTPLQQHANSANAIGSVVLVADNPTDHHIFLSAFTGERELRATSTGIIAPTPRGDVQIMTPAAYRGHFGVEPPDITNGARLAALHVKVHDRDALSAALDAGGLAFSFHMGAVIIAAEAAMGATLVFEAEGPHCGG